MTDIGWDGRTRVNQEVHARYVTGPIHIPPGERECLRIRCCCSRNSRDDRWRKVRLGENNLPSDHEKSKNITHAYLAEDVY